MWKGSDLPAALLLIIHPLEGKNPQKTPPQLPPSTALQRINKFKWMNSAVRWHRTRLAPAEQGFSVVFVSKCCSIHFQWLSEWKSSRGNCQRGIASGRCLWLQPCLCHHWDSVLWAASSGNHTADTHLHKFSFGSKPPLIWDFCVQWNSGQVKKTALDLTNEWL